MCGICTSLLVLYEECICPIRYIPTILDKENDDVRSKKKSTTVTTTTTTTATTTTTTTNNNNNIY